MNSSELRAKQAPFKNQYKENPATALVTLRAVGRLNVNDVTCQLDLHPNPTCAGLHPLTGGDGSGACSAEMLLQALVGCAGVTLGAVATAMEIAIQSGSITAEGDADFRGTLGVSRDVPVGFQEIRLKFDLESEAPPEKLEKLIELTERYCVVYQTLKNSPRLVRQS
ncbi:MAG: OsmC family protein [Planctomycetes bacterium]|nr:OsmC family protein [Planctomycetota bacterium]